MTTTNSLANTIGSLASGAVSTVLSRLPVTVSASTAATGTSTGASSGTSTKLTKAAHDFEAIFLRQMMSAADKTDFGSDAFSGQGVSTFRSQQEAQFADVAAGRDTLGIAKLLESHIGAKQGQASGSSATSPSTSTASAASGG